MRLISRCLLPLAIAGLFWSPAIAAQDVPPGIGVRLLEAPIARRDDPRAHIYVIDHVKPGAQFTRRFEVSNGTTESVTLNLYAAGASISGGGFVIAEGRGKNDLASWITISSPQVRLAPNSRTQAEATFAVPPTATAGEKYAALVVERPADPTPGTVAIAGRVAIRVYLSVGGEAEPDTDFELPAFRPIRQRDGRPAIEIDGCNTGGRAIDLTGEVELANGPGGIKAGPFPTQNATTLAPDQCHTFTIPLDKELPLGPWDATAKLRSGKEERTAEARIKFPAEAGERGEKVETREVTGTLPGIIATGFSILLLLLLTGGLLWFLLKRRRRGRDEDGSDRD